MHECKVCGDKQAIHRAGGSKCLEEQNKQMRTVLAAVSDLLLFGAPEGSTSEYHSILIRISAAVFHWNKGKVDQFVK
jgi:hypothetical protein